MFCHILMWYFLFKDKQATRSRLESSSSVSSDSLVQEFSQLASDLHDGMEVGSLVEVSLGGRQLYGVVRWYGKPRNKSEHGLVGVELVIILNAKRNATTLVSICSLQQESETEEGSDGSYLGQQFFRCAPGRGVFVSLRHCRLDSRFNSICDTPKHSATMRNYDTPSETGILFNESKRTCKK